MPLSELNALYLKPCTCTLCKFCFGTPKISVRVDACKKCFESGVIRVCARCQQIDALLNREPMQEAA